MEDRVQRFDKLLNVYPEIQERLKKLVKCGRCGAVHVFADAKDIPDKIDLRLVVIDPDHPHKRKDFESAAVKAAEAILTRHGDKPRELQNRLLFLVPDANAVQPLRDHVRRYLAWQSIVADAEQLNLDKHHEKEARKNLDDARARVEASVKEAYRFLLAPMQDPDAPDGLTKIFWEDETLPLSGSTYDKAIDAATRDREWIISAWAPPHLHTLLTKWFWKADKPAVSPNKVWMDTARYLYMPRLESAEVFLQTVRDAIPHTNWLGYAAGEKDGVYEGLLFGSPGGVYLNDGALLIHPDAAAQAGQKSEGGRRTSSAPPPSVRTGGGTVAKKASTPAQATFRRFHGTIDVDVPDPIGHFTEIVQNVIEHFSAQYGTEVSVRVDIEARRGEGFESKTVRVVRENSTTLKFLTAEFEEE